MDKSSRLITHILAGKRVDENANLPFNWQSLDINNMPEEKDKIIFHFGGNNTNRTSDANGYAKIIKSFIKGQHINNTNVISFSYITEPFEKEGLISKHYANETALLFEKTFKPMLFDDNGYIKSKKGIEHLFSKIVFSSHCAGSYFANIIIDKIYEVLQEYYSQNMADLLISKIQYFSYAPACMSEHNLTSLCINPYVDQHYSWTKALQLTETDKVASDYPKGVIKRLLKAREHGMFQEQIDSEFNKTRVILFKIGNSTYMIPSQMNPNRQVGDHSIECISKLKILNSGSEFEGTARLMNFASKLYINAFLDCGTIDCKNSFKKASGAIEGNPPMPIIKNSTTETNPVDWLL